MIMERLKSIDDLNSLRSRLKDEVFPDGVARVRLCSGTACTATGTPKVVAALEDEAAKRGLKLEIVKTGCQGLCQKGPVMKVEPQGIFYQKVKPEHAKSILAYTVQGGQPFRQSLYRDSFLSEPVPEMTNVPFYKKQLRIALRNNGLIDPRNILHYIAVGGYAALEKALGSMTPDDVLNEVDKANLRGRGGAGFPAGRKWKHTKGDKSKIKFVIANGDEGDPGAFMDRSV